MAMANRPSLRIYVEGLDSCDAPPCSGSFLPESRLCSFNGSGGRGPPRRSGGDGGGRRGGPFGRRLPGDLRHEPPPPVLARAPWCAPPKDPKADTERERGDKSNPTRPMVCVGAFTIKGPTGSLKYLLLVLRCFRARMTVFDGDGGYCIACG